MPFNYNSHPDLSYNACASPGVVHFLNPPPPFHTRPSPPLLALKGTLSYLSDDTANTAISRWNTPPPQLLGHGWRFYAAFGCLCFVNFVCALDATSLSVALPTIAKKLHGSGMEAFWAGTSFLLAATIVQPSFASLSHVFGRKEMLLLALTFFTAGAIIAALASTFILMLVGRSFQGVSGGGISALTYIIVTDMVKLRERGKWFGLINMMWAFGSVVGPVIGGTLTEKVSWRWIFWLNIPFCASAFLTIPLFLKLKPKEGKISEKIRQTDWRTVVPLTIGLLGLLVFILWSKYVPSKPILRGSMFKSATALVTYFCTVAHGMIVGSALYYIPLYFEAAKGFSPITSGIALFPWTFTTGLSAALVGALIAITGRYRWAIWIGWLLAAVGIGLLILLEADTITAMWVGISLISGLGLGILYPSMSFAIQASASNRDLPFAVALHSFFRSFGQMLGVGIGGVVFQNEVKKQLLTYPNLAPQAAKLSKDASRLVKIIKVLPPEMAKIKGEVIAAYVDSLRVLWVLMCALAGVAFVASVLFTKGKSLERELETD